MKNILDRLEAIAHRWFYLIIVSVFVLMMAGLLACAYPKTVYNIPEGACYCPSCGTVIFSRSMTL